MNQSLSKVIPAVSATALVMGMYPFEVFAATQLNKEEVVYVNLAQDGSVENIYVVNAFNTDVASNLVDYGEYTRIQNLTTTHSLQLTEDKISLDDVKGRFYYQGDLESTDIPWLINIQYYLDGNEVNPDQLAGQSGLIEIKLSVQQNEKVNPVFYDHFALQTTFVFDAEKTSNIEAEGATIANVGSQKQLIFNLLASGDKEISIKLESTDFSMEGIQMNGIPLSLKIDLPDTSEFKDRLVELQDGVVQLDDGATQLTNGVSAVYNGTIDLKDGVSSLAQGSISLRNGIFNLEDGTQRLYTGVSSFKNGVSNLLSGGTLINQGFQNLITQSDSLTNGSSQVISALSSLDDGGQSLARGINELMNEMGPLDSNLAELDEGAQLVAHGLEQVGASSESLVGASSQMQAGIIAGTQNLSSLVATSNSDEMQYLLSTLSQSEDPAVMALVQAYVSQQAAIAQISNGLLNLSENYSQFHEGLVGMSSGIETLNTSYLQVQEGISTLVTAFGTLSIEDGPLMSLKQGANTLASGLTQLHSQYEELHAGMIAYTKGTNDLAVGFHTLNNGLNDLSTGSDSLYSGTASLVDGTTQLKEGSDSLATGSQELYQGSIELMNGTKELEEGSLTLVDGTNEMRNQTSNLDEEVDAKIDEVMNEVLGEEFEMKSFVSEKNTEVSAVQFVMKTNGISLEETSEPVVKEEVELNFWEKLLQLFGWKS